MVDKANDEQRKSEMAKPSLDLIVQMLDPRGRHGVSRLLWAWPATVKVPDPLPDTPFLARYLKDDRLIGVTVNWTAPSDPNYTGKHRDVD